MFRCFCLCVLFPLCVLGQADVPLSTPSKSFTFTTDQPIWKETPAPTVLPTTKDSASAVTELYVPNDTTFQPAPDGSNTPVAPTSPPSPQPTNATTETPSPQPTNATTETPSPQPTNATTETPSPLPTNATTETPSPLPTNATTETPSPLPTNATTETPSPLPTNATTETPSPLPTNATTETPSPQPTNATTETPSPQPTNATTETPSPQPTNATTETPSPQPTNATTVSPTNSTTAFPPTPTTSPLPKVGDYVIRAERNSSACLMARMGLQFSYRMEDSFQTINLDPNPNVTKTTGTCGDASNDSTLMLVSDEIAVQFIFTNQTSKFFLSALKLTVVTGSGPNFTAVNTNLSLWEASLGSSYMCKKEQSFNITDALILNTFELQVQPFGVTNDQFSTAHECSMDDTSLLIPIIVGAALAVLILIVVIAYVIGRRKTYVGYQTL